MSDIFREVDEDIRQEQIITFVKRYGKYVLAAVVAAVIVFVATRYFESQKQAEREAAGDRFQAALALLVDDKLAEAVSDFAIVEEEAGGDDSYGLLARFRRAEALYESKDVQAAKEVYDAIVADSGVDDIYRDLARLYAANAIVDIASNEDLLERLEPLTEDGNAWRFSALELAALIHYRKGDMDSAGEMFQHVVDGAPESMPVSPRAKRMLDIIGPAPDAGQDAEGTE
ncbi:MAG: tetratricopeptide repeat protein [Proteobacteria bacterium]|nr:tetratricopeptide repeat protein [Pseudomonadota bacterium]